MTDIDPQIQEVADRAVRFGSVSIDRQSPVEGLLPNVTAAAIAASKRQIVEGFNRLEANGVQPCAASISLSDGSEINRYGDAKWEVVE